MAKATREEIQEAFGRLVGQYGLDKVTMRDLAREANISVGAIYLRFESKDALILAVEEKWLGHVKQRNQAILAGDWSPEEKLHQIVVEHINRFSSLIRENRAGFELLMGAMRLRYIGRTLRDTRREIFEAMIAAAAAALREGRDLGVFRVEDPEGTARLFVKAFTEFFSPAEVVAQKHRDVAQSAERMFQLLMRALRQQN